MLFEHQAGAYIFSRCSCGHKSEFNWSAVLPAEEILNLRSPYTCPKCKAIHSTIDFSPEQKISLSSLVVNLQQASQDQAVHKSKQYPPPNYSLTVTLVAGLILLALLALIVVTYNLLTPFGSKKESSPIDYCVNSTAAFVMAEEFVIKRLKAPATAKFPSISESDVSIHQSDDCTHTVSAYVDAQNSFGALIRTHYSATVHYQKATKKWRLISIDMQ